MTDAVDVFLAQWSAERPTMEAAPMGVIGRLARASRLVDHGVKDYFAAEGMESWEFDVLATLRRAGAPYTLTPKRLSAMTMVGSAAMTNRVDRLVRKGLVGREVDAGNRRSLLITLTARGHEVVERVIDGHVANAARLADGLEPTEQAEMNRLLRKLLLSLGDTPPVVDAD